jgi:NH3-dependent NAD+ synthetase
VDLTCLSNFVAGISGAQDSSPALKNARVATNEDMSKMNNDMNSFLLLLIKIDAAIMLHSALTISNYCIIPECVVCGLLFRSCV